MTEEIKTKIKIEGDSSGAEQAVKKTNTAMSGLTSTIIKANLASKALEKGMGAFVSLLKTGFNEALETERALIKLRAATMSYGSASATIVKQLRAQAEGFEQLTNYESDQIMNLQVMALNFGINKNRMDDMIKATISLANATDGNLDNAFARLANTQRGVLDRTLKIIPELERLSEAELKSGKAIDIVNEKMASFLGTETEGTIGGIKSLQLAWKNLSETIVNDSKFMSALTSLASVGGSILGGMAKIYGNISSVPADLAALAFGYMDKDQIQAEIVAKNRAPMSSSALTGGGSIFTGNGKSEDKSKGKKADPFSVEFDFSVAEEGFARLEKYEQEKTDLMRQYGDMRLTYSQEITEKILEDQYNAAEKEKALQKEKMDTIAYYAGKAGDLAAGAFEAWLQDGEKGAKGFALMMMKSIGQQLFAKGVADIAMATANAAFGNPGAIAQYPAAIAETTVGAALMAGTIPAIKGAAKSGGGASISGYNFGSSGAGGEYSGGAFWDHRSVASGGGGGPINIYLSGVMTSHEAGKELSRLLAETRRRGQ